MKTHLLCLAAAVFASVATAAPARTLNVRAVTMADTYPGTELYAHTDAKEPGAKVTVKSFLNHEFDAVKLASGTLILTTKPEPASVSDKASVVANLKIPANMSSCIVLFLPGATDDTGSSELIDDSKAAFPPGSTLMINVTKSDVKLTLETKDFSVKAGTRLLIQNPPVGESNASAVKAFYQEGGAMTQFSSTSWPHPGTKRVIQIATEGRTSGKPELRGLKDIVTVK